ncbi:pentatricopeptide repeat-containing protein At4g32430, mitochondrial [Magnolia sinica]|uniref:pentatricopeptide repeat-containing protein At4g32430, mitochondrial n=1 Tax=Magnolia sinica TaxID=86752 RepID=UPI002659C583|nr:pentatricopeptide repeat-containing protein At4g32430, mitochondrial [Magnolia sinica]
MLKRLSKHLPSRALETLHNLLRLGWSDDIDHVAISIALKCFRGDLCSGTQIHAITISSGLDSYVSVSNSLMNMYSKSRQFDQALVIFEALSNRDIVSWNTILSGFHQSDDALGFMLRMCQAGIGFDAVTYTTALAFCAEVGELNFGLQLHSLVLKSGFDSETFVGNALISFYARYHCLNEAKRVFDEMSNRDLVSWNALISGYTQEGDYELEAIWVFVEMLKEGMELDHVSFASVISACGHERSLDLGRQIHGLALKAGYGIHVSVSNVLLSMYSKCEIAKDAKVVFENMVERNVVSWTTMISIDEGNAVSLFNEMRRDGVYPNDVTFVGLVPAVSTENSVKDGQMIHVFCLKTGFLSEVNVSNCLITMYAKFKSMEESKRVFDELNYREIVSWNALISGYAQNGLCQEALQTFSFMILEEKPNQFTFGSILSSIASAEAVSLMHGRQSHCWTIKLGLNTDEVVLGALVHMYAKRGSITESQLVFDEVPQRSLVAWTAIITSHAMHGDYESVMSLFKRMERARVQPDSITFLAVLTACSRRGMVDVGCQVFNSMVRDHLIEPSAEHFSCMVDMLGRAGQLEEAEEFMKRMPTGPSLSALQSLLGACRIHGNVEMGKRVSDALMEMGPMESGVYVLMSNIYAEKGEWEKVAKIRKGMRERGVKKEVGCSWVDMVHVDGAMHMHGFTSDDRSHPRAEEICRMVECLGLEMRFLERRGF